MARGGWPVAMSKNSANRPVHVFAGITCPVRVDWPLFAPRRTIFIPPISAISTLYKYGAAEDVATSSEKVGST